MVEATDRPAFGKLLRELRVAAGLSQEALAERARMSVDGIGALERGVNKAPQRETLVLLMDALALPAEQRRAVEAAASRSSRPRARGRQAMNHNLTRPLTPLFGREQDLATVEDLLTTSHILTLTGAGGVGKTRLAIDAGFASLRHYPDGVWFVDLAAAWDGEGVARAIAGVVGVHEHPDQALLDLIVKALQRKGLLLILDNCEHLVSAAGTAAESLLAGCPEARILATSRQPLHVAGEQIYRVASLDAQASVSFFVDSVRRADVSLVIDETDLSIVQRICERLDGIALAIELAAAQVKVLSLAQIEEMLAERFRVLTGSGRLARQRTMRAVIDWSYDLLSVDERPLIERLGVFAADFSFEAALAICADARVDKGSFLELLGSLVDKSLVTSERHAKSRRFRLLETVRAYALEKLGDRVDAYRRRHAEFYLEIVRAAEASSRPPASALENEYENLRQALDWSIDAGGDVALGVTLLGASREFLLQRGLGAESAHRAERALLVKTMLSPSLEALAWETLAGFRGDLLLPETSFEAVNRSLALYEELQDNAGIGRSLRIRGIANLRFGSFVAADEDLRRSLELTKAYGHQWDLARTLASLAVSYEMTGRLEESCATTQEVLAIAQADGDERAVAISSMNLAEAEFALGEPARAASRLREVLTSRIVRRNGRIRANVKSNLAAYLIALHLESEAHALARTAVFEARDAGDEGIMACAIGHLAAMLAAHDPRAAARLLGYVDGVFAGRYRREGTERFTHELLLHALHERLSDHEFDALSCEGAALSETQAIRLATRPR